MQTGTIAKYAGIALALAGLLVLPGCWVQSIHGLYEEGMSKQDPDVVVDQRLTGSWSASEPGIGDENKCNAVVVITSKDDIYGLRWPVQEGCSDAEKNYEARLVRLDAYYFLDALAPQDAVCDTCIATHQIFRVDFDRDGFSLTPIDSDWLNKSLAARSLTLATLPDDSDTVTASTADLKNFCRKFAGDPTVFRPDSALTFTRVSAAHPASHH